MNFTIENQGSSNILVYELLEDEQLDTMSLGMLSNNSIPGLLDAVYQQMDKSRYIKYNITSKISAETVFSSPMSKKRLLAILNSMVKGFLNAEDYMLDASTILLDSKYIFIDGATGEASMICLPILREGKQPDLRAFFKEMVFEWTKFEQSDDFSFMASLLNYFNSVPVLSLVDFKALLEKLANEKASAPVRGTERANDRDTVYPEKPKYSEKPRGEEKKHTPPAQPGGKGPNTGDRPGGKNGLEGKFGTGGPYRGKTEEKPAEKADDKGMSVWYLLQHFSKENLETFKSQKEAGKEAKPAPAPEKKPKKKAQDPGAGRGFSIPGDPPPEFEASVREEPAAPEKQWKQPEPPVTREPEKKLVEKRDKVHFGGDPDEGSDLTVMGEEVGPNLVRVSTGEVIELNKTPFRIGRERRSVDYAITGNPTISKKHIEVRFEKGEFQVYDEDSLNHTYINGKRIPKKTWSRIRTGDILRLNNEEFECKLN
ncbi:MAG: FHA domain-containing protein [Oscillospiraceae bacterium]|nr:FHA domain-containing protein [Oscillospiraceae bacterium]